MLRFLRRLLGIRDPEDRTRAVQESLRQIDQGWRGASVPPPRFSGGAASASPPPTGRPARPSPVPPAPATLSSLDASKFAPLSQNEVADAAKSMNSQMWNAWSMRRDRIPPTTDANTALIDRAMVGMGYLSPEELAYIHAVGEKMEGLRPDMIAARAQAERIVAASEDERKRIKEQKKAEAAERKRERAEQVAHRRATDIVFLGRGVSKGLAERESDAAKLAGAGLPALATPAEVAAALGIEIPKLRWLAFHSEAPRTSHYVQFSVAKKSGGERRLSAPMPELARCQRWIFDHVLAKLDHHECAHGFIRGRSTATNAAPHAGQQAVVNIDLADFFPSITFPRVKGMFGALGYSPAAATILALLCTESPRRRVEYAGHTYHAAEGPRALPQGACTSPALANLCARRLDARLSGACAKLGWTYTRYADDLSFSASGSPAQHAGRLMAWVRHIAADEGFAINAKKTRVQRRHVAQSVTGVVVNDRPGVPRKLARRLRAILHRAAADGLEAQNRDGREDFPAWVAGMIAYISGINPEQGRRLGEALNALNHPGARWSPPLARSAAPTEPAPATEAPPESPSPAPAPEPAPDAAPPESAARPLAEASLEFREGNSDKVYRAAVVPQAGGFMVTFAYGRRGQALREGTKTETPVTEERARAIFANLVASKRKKGYGDAAADRADSATENAAATGTEPTSPASALAPAPAPAAVPNFRAQLANPLAPDRSLDWFVESRDYAAQERFRGARLILAKTESGQVSGCDENGAPRAVPAPIAKAAAQIPGEAVLDGVAVCDDRFYAFDILSRNGSDLAAKNPRPLGAPARSHRRGRIGEEIRTAAHADSADKKSALVGRLRAEGRPGIVFKRLDARYAEGKPASGGD
ncbi:MAG: reverse transcriptase domain-containing protein [Verrucomicrobiales bacterium]